MISQRIKEQLVVPEDCMDIDETLESLVNIAKYIANTDLTSTVIDRARIRSIRTVVDLFENYVNQRETIETKTTSWKRGDVLIRNKRVGIIHSVRDTGYDIVIGPACLYSETCWKSDPRLTKWTKIGSIGTRCTDRAITEYFGYER